jgi:hypothetical protein
VAFVRVGIIDEDVVQRGIIETQTRTRTVSLRSGGRGLDPIAAFSVATHGASETADRPEPDNRS